MSERAVPGEFYSSYEQRKTAPSGRLCAFKGCETVLSIYNEGDRCATHKHSNLLVKKGKLRKR